MRRHRYVARPPLQSRKPPLRRCRSRMAHPRQASQLIRRAVDAALAADAAREVLVADRADVPRAATGARRWRTRDLASSTEPVTLKNAALALRAARARISLGPARLPGLSEQARRSVAASVAALGAADRLADPAAIGSSHAGVQTPGAASLALLATESTCVHGNAVRARVRVQAAARAVGRPAIRLRKCAGSLEARPARRTCHALRSVDAARVRRLPFHAGRALTAPAAATAASRRIGRGIESLQGRVLDGRRVDRVSIAATELGNVAPGVERPTVQHRPVSGARAIRGPRRIGSRYVETLGDVAAAAAERDQGQ